MLEGGFTERVCFETPKSEWGIHMYFMSREM